MAERRGEDGDLMVDDRLRRLPQLTATPYLASIVVTAMLSAYLNYLKDRLDPQGYALFGQAPGVYVPFLLFPVTLILWLLCGTHGPRSRWTVVFLSGLAVSWILHMVLIHVHDDQYVLAVWLFVPILVMLLLKPPTWNSALLALRAMAWLGAAIMVVTYILEKTGLVPRFNVADPGLITYFEKRYLLPLNGLLGIDGRWDGPFGYNAKTAFTCALIILIALATRPPARWILMGIAVVALLATGSRAGLLALAAGLLTMACLTQSGPLARISRRLRVFAGSVLLIAVGAYLYFLGSLGLTGRIGGRGLWNYFVELWQESIWIGIGQRGIASAPDRISWMDPAWMDAHSIYIQELTKFGIIGFVVIFGVLGVGVGIAVAAALRGQPLPLALLVVYLVAGATDLLHDGWQGMGTVVVMIVIAVLGASAWTSESQTLRSASAE